MLIVGCIFAAGTLWTCAEELYVAPTGRDTNPGTQAKPVATLQWARELVRDLKTKAAEPITVWLEPGTYYLGESLVFRSEDSGTPARPITYQAIKEGTVILSGGMSLRCQWKPLANGVFVCGVPEVKNHPLHFSELYVNGRRQIRARYPNGDSREPQPAGYIRTKGADKWPHKELYFDPATFTQRHWSHPEDAVVVCFQRIDFDRVPFWNGQWRVRGLDLDRHALLLGQGGHQQLLFHYMQAYRPGIYPDMPFYVENVREELDAPGEWYFDSREAMLYYLPPSGLELGTAVVEPALLQRVVQFLGTKDKPVHHITLRGLWIAHAASTYFEPYSPAGMGDYTIQRGGAVFIEGGEDITVDRCSLDGNNGNGFYVNCHARRVKLINSRVVDVGESGICYTGKDNYRPDKRYKCPACGFDHWWGWDPLPEDDIPVDCEAVNNVVHDVGVFAKQCGGVFIANSLHIRIAHNHIYNCPRAGINVNNGVYGGHLFENNDLHDTVRETSDHGPFNSYGRDSYWCQHVNHTGNLPEGQIPHSGNSRHDFGSFAEIARSARETTIIRSNRFAGPRLGGRFGPGLQHPIDLDDGSSNYEVCGNLGIKMSIKTFCSSYCRFHDNVFVEASRIDLIQPFDGHLEIRDNRFINDLPPGEAEARFFQGVRFGVTDQFPAWLRDPDAVAINPHGGRIFEGDPVALLLVTTDGSPPEIRYTLDGSEPTVQSPLYQVPLKLRDPGTVKASVFRQGQRSGQTAQAAFGPLLRKPDVFLDDLPLLRMKSGNENPEKKTQLRRNCIGQPLRVGGISYQSGIGDHAGNGFPAELVYALRPAYRRFVALVGVDDQTAGKGSLFVKFSVDGIVKVQSAVLRGGMSPEYFDIELPSGSKELAVAIEDAGDGYEYDDADFANAGFLLERRLED
jgi:hypothetical protein